MKNLISASFSIGAQKDVVSVDFIENYYLCEATGSTPSVSDSRWQKVEDGGSVPVPTSAAPFLWHKYITVLTDGSKQDPVIEFKGSLGKNGIDYDLVPSHSSIIKSEDGTLSPTAVSCSMIMRNADGTAEKLSSIPSGYSIKAYRDATAQTYTLGSTVSTANVSVVTFVLLYNSVEIERHDIHVITEGAQGIAGRGIQSQDIRFLAKTSNSTPATPTNDSTWNTWKSLANSGYSASTPYLYKCVRTIFVDGNNNTSTEYYVEGPTVWGQDGKTPFVVDIDNEMTAVAVSSAGLVTAATNLSFNIRAYYGVENITNNCSMAVVSSLPSGFTVDVTTTKGTPTITIAKNTSPAELTEITFRVTHETYGSRDVVFSIAAIKAGGVGQDAVIYQLLPSLSEIAVARTDNGGYNPSTVSLTCGYTKRKGNSAASSVAHATAAFDGYNIYYRRYNRTSGWERVYYRYGMYWVAHLNSLNVETYSKVEFVICTSTADMPTSLTGVIDREVVPVIADGLNGTSPFTVDISKEMTSVALTNAGVTEADFEETFSLKAFYGSTDVTASLTNVSAYADPNNSNIKIDASDLSNIKISISAGNALDATTSIVFTCVHPTYGVTTVTHTLAGVKAGKDGSLFELLPNLTQISFARTSSGSLTPSSRTVTVNIKKVVGESVSVLSIAGSGLTVRYSLSSMPVSPSSGSAFNTSLTITSGTSSTNLYLAAFNANSVLVDRETIPIIKDGAKGGTGETGNGIDEVNYYRLFTQSFEAPAVNDAWADRDLLDETMLSQTNRYLWELKETTYTKTSDVDTEIYLVAQFASSPCANLLEDTAFLSDAEMDAWEECNGSVMSQVATGLPQNGWQLNPDLKAGYVEMLKQIVFDGTSVKKIKPNTWYTLSFYAAQASSISLFSGSTYNGEDNTQYYQLVKTHQSFRIEAGQTVKVRFTGRVNSTTYATMRAFVWLNSLDESTSWITSTAKDIKSTANTTVEIEFTNNQSSACMCHVAAYMLDENNKAVSTGDTKYRGYCTSVIVDRGMTMDSYLYRAGSSTSAVSTSEPWYVDGKKITSPQTLSDGTYVSRGSDGCIRWKLNGSGIRHTVTFKTANFSSSITDVFRVLFRLTCLSNYGWVCMPKLEENTMATEWSENSADRYADDMSHIYVGQWKASTSGDASTYYLYALSVRHVVRARTSATGDYTFFRLKKRTPTTGYCSLTEPYADTAYWERADYLKFVAADLLLSEEVITDKLTVSKIRSKNDTFVVDENGNVTANGGTFKNIKITGSTRNPFQKTGSLISEDFNDNVAMYSDEEGTSTIYNLPWDKEQIGRRIVIANFYWNGKISLGASEISAPSGKYFFIDGKRQKTITINRQVVELIGFGTGDTFYGWIVLNSVDAYSKYSYGSNFKIVAQGLVGYVNSKMSISYQCVTNNTMSASRLSEGKYRVNFPSSWFAGKGSYMVWLQGAGSAVGATTPIKACLYAKEDNYFDIVLSDDASPNDGQCLFMMSNVNFTTNWEGHG